MNRTRALLWLAAVLFGTLLLCLYPIYPRHIALAFGGLLVGTILGLVRVQSYLTCSVMSLFLVLVLLVAVEPWGFIGIGLTLTLSYAGAKKY